MSEYKRFSDRAIDIINELHKERLMALNEIIEEERKRRTSNE